KLIELHKKAVETSLDTSRLTSIYAEGDVVSKGLAFPCKLQFKKPLNMRLEIAFMGQKFLNIINDSLTWEYNPFADVKNIVKSREDFTSQESKETGPFDYVNWDLIHYKSKKNKVSIEGKEKLDSLQVFVVKVTKPDGEKITFYLNSQTYLVNKIEKESGVWYFLDYSTFDNMQFPRLIVQQTENEFKMKLPIVRFNTELSNKLFIIPDSAYADSDRGNKIATLLDEGDRLAANNKFDDAITKYSKYLLSHPNSERAFHARGSAKLETRDYYGAIGDFNRVLELNPKHAEAYNNRGLAKYYLNDHQNAIADYDKALELKPALISSVRNRGLAHFSQGKYDESITDFTIALKHSPTDSSLYFNRGVASAQREKFIDALQDYRQSIKLGYLESNIFNYKGVSEFRLEQYDSALISFTKAVEKAEENSQYIENLGRTFYELGRYKDAEQVFERCLKNSPDNPEISNLLGLCNYFQENYKGAIRLYSRAIELNPKESVYFENRAAAKELLEDYTGAISDYDESIKIYPNDASIFYKRGILKIRTSKKIEGCSDLGTANEMKYEAAKDAIIQNCN
ncbi:MAG: tetratricopeptide repeat protein, partial [Bacteroidota bacterium]